MPPVVVWAELGGKAQDDYVRLELAPVPVDADITDADIRNTIDAARSRARAAHAALERDALQHFLDRHPEDGYEKHLEMIPKEGLRQLTDVYLDALTIGQMYIAAEANYQACVELAKNVRKSGKYLVLDSCPAVAWALFVEYAITEVTRNGQATPNTIWTLRTDLKHRLPAAIDPVIASPLRVEIELRKENGQPIIEANGQPVDPQMALMRLREMAEGLEEGESKRLTKTVDVNYAASAKVMHFIAPALRSLDTSTPEGMQAYADIMAASTVMPAEHLKVLALGRRDDYPKPPLIEGETVIYNRIDQSTGECVTITELRVPFETENGAEWGKTQLSARVRFSGMPHTIQAVYVNSEEAEPVIV